MSKKTRAYDVRPERLPEREALGALLRAAQAVIESHPDGYEAAAVCGDRPYWLVSTKAVARLINAVCAATGATPQELQRARNGAPVRE